MVSKEKGCSESQAQGSGGDYQESRQECVYGEGKLGVPPFGVSVKWPVLVKKRTFCVVDLDVEISTKKPGWATMAGICDGTDASGHAPDLDNLLKTILDGLRFPGDQNANPDAETYIAIAEGRPFYCLVEDDALIRRIDSRSTVLLEEDLTDKDGANSRVTVNVVVLSYRFPNYSGNAAPPLVPGIKGLLTPLAPSKS